MTQEEFREKAMSIDDPSELFHFLKKSPFPLDGELWKRFSDMAQEKARAENDGFITEAW